MGSVWLLFFKIFLCIDPLTTYTIDFQPINFPQHFSSWGYCLFSLCSLQPLPSPPDVTVTLAWFDIHFKILHYELQTVLITLTSRDSKRDKVGQLSCTYLYSADLRCVLVDESISLSAYLFRINKEFEKWLVHWAKVIQVTDSSFAWCQPFNDIKLLFAHMNGPNNRFLKI